MASKGILLCAWGKPCYGYAAFNFAASLKHHSPDVHITLMCDEVATRDYADQTRTVFDSIVSLGEPISDPGLFKVKIYDKLPYDYTLFLDVDALCINPIEPLIDKLIADYKADESKFYRCPIHAWYDHTSPNDMPMMYWAHKSVIWDKYGFDESHRIPGSQSSLQFIAKCERAEKFFHDLSELMEFNPIPLDQLKNKWGGTQPDELYLNIQIARDHLTPDIEKAMWFVDNKAMRPGQLIEQGWYILSYFGVKERMQGYFKDWYDKDPVRFLRKMGFANHYWKSHAVFDQKHAATRVPQIKREAVVQNFVLQQKAKTEVFTPVNKKKIHLFTSYYTCKTQARQNELDTCIINNLNNPLIEKVFLLSDCPVAFTHDKLVIQQSPRPKFRDMVDFINLHSGEINIMCNSDIYTDQSIGMVMDFDLTNRVLCLCRHDLMATKQTRFIEAEYSQDTWVWEGKLNFTGGDYYFGVLGCDNVFPYQLVQSGYTVHNPSRHIKTTHLHLVNERSYSEKGRLPRPYLHVPVGGIDELKKVIKPTLLIIQPGKVGDILKVLPVAYHYSKQFEVFWLCPDSYHPMFEYVDYVKPVTTKTGNYDKIIDLSFGLNQKSPLHREWIKRKPTLDSFVTLKYELSQVPVSECFRLQYTRNYEKENALFELLTDGMPYSLCHLASDYGNRADAPDLEHVIEFKPVKGYTIFDWRKVIEQAQEIHAIDSSLVNFADVCDVTGKLFYYITDKVPDQADRTLLQKDWETINQLEGVST